jgi:hypothetical protein
LATAAKLNDLGAELLARMAVMEALFETRDHDGALRTLHEIESTLSRFPEYKWRTLASIARADAQYVPLARAALNDLKQAWGNEVVNRYLSRPDLARLARPLIQTVNASQK